MQDKAYGWGLPIDISAHGGGIDVIIHILNVTIAVLFLGWFCFLLYTLFKFRARPGHKAEYHGKHFKLPTVLEVGVALFEVLLLAAFSAPVWMKLKAPFPADATPLQIRVVAQQFAWNVHYPGPDGVFGASQSKLMDSVNPVGLDPADPKGKDDIVTVNQLHVPINTPVEVKLSSKDVIHSFAIPVMRVKQDAIPGYVIDVRFVAKSAGDYEIACAQLCGLGHYRMRGFFVSQTPEAFQTWLKEQAPAAPAAQ